ncbi:DUF7116 family protein [Haloarcula laminariae]|uniref:DUF7116 family protein n=1 Tax=Haloarcula laminariae TaxID=2961577 RepID=UPI0021CA65F2|nr:MULTISPECIES: hypothetical protein [Halomicroarcula]
MAAVSTPLDEQARSIFDDIGYTVSRTDEGLRAAHKWREVGVTVLEDGTALPESGEMHCIVTRAPEAPDVGDRLARMDVGYDWAVIGVREDGGYDVVRP